MRQRAAAALDVAGDQCREPPRTVLLEAEESN